jgi:hypothetical protein
LEFPITNAMRLSANAEVLQNAKAKKPFRQKVRQKRNVWSDASRHCK